MDNENFKTHPREFFLHLLHIGTLYASVIAFLVLAFQVINISIPDALDIERYYYEGPLQLMRWAIAWLIVVFPVCIGTGWRLQKKYKEIPERRKAKVRRWLVYLTLFFASCIIIADVISIVFNLLDGELTIKFLLKFLSVFVVSGLVFGYYSGDGKKESISGEERWKKWLVWASIALILGVLIGGISKVGSPLKERQRKFDMTRVRDLQSIEQAILNYWIEYEALPISLEEVKNRGFYMNNLYDNETNELYEYDAEEGNFFNLCAVFSGISDLYDVRGKRDTIVEPIPVRIKGEGEDRRRFVVSGDDWSYSTGRKCFSREIREVSS